MWALSPTLLASGQWPARKAPRAPRLERRAPHAPSWALNLSSIVPGGQAQCRAPCALSLHAALSPRTHTRPRRPRVSFPPTRAPCSEPRGNERKHLSKRAALWRLPTRLAPVGLAPHLSTQSRHLSTGRQAATGATLVCGEQLPVAATRLHLPLCGRVKARPWSVFTRAPGTWADARTARPPRASPTELAAGSMRPSANPASPSTGSCLLRGHWLQRGFTHQAYTSWGPWAHHVRQMLARDGVQSAVTANRTNNRELFPCRLAKL